MTDKQKRLLPKLIKVIIFDIISILLIVYMMYTVFYKHDQPTFMGYSIATVRSESMIPLLEVDDVVITQKQDKYERDDVIIYKVWKIHVVHRIINVYEKDGITMYTTKGDNNDLRDRKQSTSDNIVGKVIYILPGFGTLIKFISYATVIAIISFTIGYIYDYKKGKKKGKSNVSD